MLPYFWPRDDRYFRRISRRHTPLPRAATYEMQIRHAAQSYVAALPYFAGNECSISSFTAVFRDDIGILISYAWSTPSIFRRRRRIFASQSIKASLSWTYTCREITYIALHFHIRNIGADI